MCIRDRAQTLAEQLAGPEHPLVLDVRTPREWQETHIPGSVNLPLNRLSHQLDQVPRDRPVVVHCASGYRSAIAVSLMERQGFQDVADLVGGFAAWEASQLDTVSA